MLTAPLPQFPSIAHAKILNERVKCDNFSAESLRDLIPENKRGYASLSEEEKQHWHAYDYGWRRVFVNDHNKYCIVDPPVGDTGQGRFFDRELAKVTEQMYKAQRPKRAEPRITAADEAAGRGDYDLDRHFREQDRIRAAAMPPGDGRNPDGTWTAESIAFARLCVVQVEANAAIFMGRSQAGASEGAIRRPSNAAAEALGVKATEKMPIPTLAEQLQKPVC